MTNKILSVVSIVLVVVAIRPLAVGQAVAARPLAPRDWQGLRSLKPGEKIHIQTKNGRMIEGKFAELAGDKLNLSEGLWINTIEQSEIQSVHLVKSHKKRAIVGAIVGGALGLVIGASVGSKIDVRARQSGQFEDALTTGDAVAFYSMLGGAAAGYALGHVGKRQGKLLYESK